MQQNRIIGIIGPIGSGKTEHCASLYRLLPRAAVFNAAGDQTYRTHSTVIVEDDPKALRLELAGESFRICFDTEMLEQGQRSSIIYTYLAPFLMECYYTGGMTAVLDEAHQICSPWSLPFEVAKCVRLGRHQGLSLIFVSQRFASVHRELTYNAHELHMFRITEPADLAGIRERCGDEVARNVQNIRRIRREYDGGILRGECVIWRAEDGSFEIRP